MAACYPEFKGQQKNQDESEKGYLYLIIATEDGIPYKYMIPLNQIDNLEQLIHQSKVSPGERKNLGPDEENWEDCFGQLKKKFRKYEFKGKEIWGMHDSRDYGRIINLLVADWE